MWFKSRDYLSWRRSTLHERLLLEKCQIVTEVSSLICTHPMMKLLVSHWSTVSVALNARISCCLEDKDEAQPSDCHSRCVIHVCHFPLENLLSR